MSTCPPARRPTTYRALSAPVLRVAQRIILGPHRASQRLAAHHDDTGYPLPTPVAVGTGMHTGTGRHPAMGTGRMPLHHRPPVPLREPMDQVSHTRLAVSARMQCCLPTAAPGTLGTLTVTALQVADTVVMIRLGPESPHARPVVFPYKRDRCQQTRQQMSVLELVTLVRVPWAAQTARPRATRAMTRPFRLPMRLR